MELTGRMITTFGALLCSESKLSRLIPRIRQTTVIGFSAMALLVLDFPAHGQAITNGEFAMTTGNTTSFPMSSGTGGPFAPDNWTFAGEIGCVVFPSSTSLQTNACGPSFATLWPGWTLSPNGGNFVAIDGDPSFAGYISQTISGFTIGQSYTVSFEQAASQFQNHYGGTTEQWLVTFDDFVGRSSPYASQGLCDPKVLINSPGCQSQNSSLMVPPLVGSGATEHSGFFSWIPQSMTFIAHAAVEVLSFFAVGTPANGIAPPVVLLDSVSITPHNYYLEVCKASSTTTPVPASGIYNFTVTGSAFSSPSNPLRVPVGECSGPISVGSSTTPPTATITELPSPNAAVETVTAFGYSPPPTSKKGTRLVPGSIKPGPNPPGGTEAMVMLQQAALGDTSTETVVTFTNYKAPPAQLKVCKVQGTGITTPIPFMFGVTFGSASSAVMVKAGPMDEGGYCLLIDRTAPVGSSVFVNETVAGSVYGMPAITVNGVPTTPSNCTPSRSYSCQVEFAAAAGINEVSFTNCLQSLLGPVACDPRPLPGQGLAIANYSLVSQAAVVGSPMQSYMTYQADMLNSGTTILTPIMARLTSLDPSVQVIGQGVLSFASAPANSPVASSNTFIILANPTVPLDSSKLSWAYYSSRSVPPSTAPLTITTTSLNNGVVGAEYSQTLAATGGTGPYTWTLTAGRLPAGLTLNPTTGVINGMPVVEGSGILTFQVKDASNTPQTEVTSFTMTIGPAPPAL